MDHRRNSEFASRCAAIAGVMHSCYAIAVSSSGNNRRHVVFTA
jgi:hypothetical protein